MLAVLYTRGGVKRQVLATCGPCDQGAGALPNLSNASDQLAVCGVLFSLPFQLPSLPYVGHAHKVLVRSPGNCCAFYLFFKK